MIAALLDDSPRTRRQIFLNDHLAVITGELRVARRAERSNRGTPLGADLDRLAGEIADDRAALAALLDAEGLPRNPVKPALVAAAEVIGRFKPNGRLRGYSTLSRVIELESVAAGAATRVGVWRILRAAGGWSAGADADLAARVERARRQQRMLEAHLVAAGRAALAE